MRIRPRRALVAVLVAGAAPFLAMPTAHAGCRRVFIVGNSSTFIQQIFFGGISQGTSK